MAIVFNCPSCGKSISAPDTGAGKRGKCPGCREPIVVPAADLPPSEDVYDADVVDDGVYDADVVDDSSAGRGRNVSSALDEFTRDPGHDVYDAEETDPYADEYEVERPSRRRRSSSYDDEDDYSQPRSRRRSVSYDDEMDEDEKQCPSCGEMIRSSARRCRYCGEDFGGGSRRRRGGRRSRSSGGSGDATSAITLGILGIIIGLVCCWPAGLIMGIQAINKANEAGDDGAAVTGKVLGFIAVGTSILSGILSILIIAGGG